MTRFLSSKDFTSTELWELTKSMVKEVAREDGVIIVDDTIEEKPSTSENEMVSRHYDHGKGKAIKGINIISVL